jgi:hypothetical protein
MCRFFRYGSLRRAAFLQVVVTQRLAYRFPSTSWVADGNRTRNIQIHNTKIHNQKKLTGARAATYPLRYNNLPVYITPPDRIQANTRAADYVSFYVPFRKRPRFHAAGATNQPFRFEPPVTAEAQNNFLFFTIKSPSPLTHLRPD